MSRVLIAGCGDIGSALGARLADAGHEVWGLRRSAAPLPAGVRPLRGDLTRPGDLAGLPGSLDTVLYIATPDTYEDAAYAAAFVRGPENLIDALSSGPDRPRRFLFVSSTGVYAQDDGQWVDETSPTLPRSFSGRRLLEGERLVLGGPIPATVVRFGGIYGRSEGRLVRRVREGATCRESPPRYTNRIHRDDCVAVLQHLMDLADPAEIYLGVDCEPAPECVVMDWLAGELGLPRPARAEAAGDARGGNKRCGNARLVATGYRFAYPTFREGYRASLTAAGAA